MQAAQGPPRGKSEQSGEWNFEYDKGKLIWTREDQYTRHDGSKVIVEDHSAGHKFLYGVGNQGSHFDIRSIENTRTGKLAGRPEHYNY